MIRPHLDYVDFVVDSGSAEKVKKFDTLERKAIRRIEYCVNTANRQEINVLREKYKIEDLRLRRKRNLVKIMYSQSSDINNLKKATTDKNLRSGNTIKLDNNFTNKTRHSTEAYAYGTLFLLKCKRKLIDIPLRRKYRNIPFKVMKDLQTKIVNRLYCITVYMYIS